MSTPHCEKGQGEEMELSSVGGCFVTLANRWHFSQFRTIVIESLLIPGQENPALTALCARTLDPEGLPHIPSWASRSM